MQPETTPLDFLNIWDFILIFAGILVRFLFVMKTKVIEFGETFEFSKYFDAQHVIRWGFHVVFSLTALFVVPQVFIEVIAPKYLPGVKSWTFLGSSILGFLGYDLVKHVEKLTLGKLKKLGVK